MSPDPLRGKGNVSLADLITLREARDRLPRKGGRKVDLATVYRWAGRGVKGVRLRTAKVGGVMYTCEVWLWDFLNREHDGAPLPPAPAGEAGHEARRRRTPAEDRRALAHARRNLRARGLLPESSLAHVRRHRTISFC